MLPFHVKVQERLQRLDELPPPLLLLDDPAPTPVAVKPERLEAALVKPERLEVNVKPERLEVNVKPERLEAAPVKPERLEVPVKPELPAHAVIERGTVAPLAGLILKVGAIYKCAVCGCSDASYAEVAEHVWIAHKGKRQLCPECPGVSFDDCHGIRAHLEAVHGRKRFACGTCPSLFGNCYNYIRHQCRYKITRGYMREHCPICMAYCSYGEKARVEHVETVHGLALAEANTGVTCPACSVKCESYAAYKAHEGVCRRMV